MADDPIPLYDGDPTGAEIIQEDDQAAVDASSGKAAETTRLQPIRSNRRSPRKSCERVSVCFAPSDPHGRVEHVECPMEDLAKGGCAIEFDRQLEIGVRGSVAYQALGGRPVRVPCVVRSCRELTGGRYRLGLKFERYLDQQELRPAKMRSGRDVALGFRLRKLKPPE